jgi:DnaD/phage-associated family protein
MANPQKENGYTSIANEIRDEIFLREFKPTHKDMLELIWRMSYGCMGRKFVYIDNYKYFEIIGIKKSHVKERLDYLIDNNVLHHIGELNVIVFNKNFDEWKIPKVSDYERRKKLLGELLNVNLSYKFGNEVTEMVTKLRIKGNEVTDKREQPETGSPTVPMVPGSPKESIKIVVVEADVYKFFNNNIGLISPFQSQSIGSFLDEGLTPELMMEAMKDSLGADNKWKYLDKTLNNCLENGIKTLEQYNAKKVERKNADKKRAENKQEKQCPKQNIEVFRAEDDPNYELFKNNAYGGVKNGKNVAAK